MSDSNCIHTIVKIILLPSEMCHHPSSIYNFEEYLDYQSLKFENIKILIF